MRATLPHRARKAAPWLALAPVVAVVALTPPLFLRPALDRPSRADAVVVLGPGRHGERFAEAMRLMRRRVAPILVVSESSRPARWPLERALCARRDAICFRARPFNTRGEAREVARLARRRRWRRLVVVTSTYHVTRARLLYERCFDGRIDVVGARPGGGGREEIGLVAHEWGGLLAALTVFRGC